MTKSRILPIIVELLLAAEADNAISPFLREKITNPWDSSEAFKKWLIKMVAMKNYDTADSSINVVTYHTIPILRDLCNEIDEMIKERV